MQKLTLNVIVEELPNYTAEELGILASAVKAVRQLKESANLSNDSLSEDDADDAGMSFDRLALEILEDKETYQLTLADQALLASLVLSEVYRQGEFSSRDVNKAIADADRPRVAHITSTIFGLMSRNYLVGETKQMSLTSEGRAKARGLIGALRRRLQAA